MVPPVALRDWTLVVACALLPLATLLDLGNNFHSDWSLHVWAVQYFERYFIAHHTLPAVVNTPELIGLAFPQFYAFPLYAAGALVATVVGPDAALRSLVMAAALILASQAYLTLRQLTRSRAAALVVTFAISTAPYALTNLFSRGAIPEYVAVALISAATCAWLRFAFASSGTRDAWVAVLCYVAGASIHPITALVGGVFCVATFVALTFAGGRLMPTLRIAVPAAVLALSVLSPWLYTVARFARDINISKGDYVGYYFEIDNVANRLSALPQDARVEHAGLLATATPYLDVQVNFPLLVLATLLAGDAALRLRAKQLTWSRPLAFATAFFTAFVVLAIASGSPALGAILFHPFAMMQFAYRFTTYLDLLLLLTVGVLLYVARGNAILFERRVPAMLLVCGLLALHNGLVKTAHSVALAVHPAPGPGPFSFLSRALSLPFGYPAGDYTTGGRSLSAIPTAAAAHVPNVALPVADGAEFGTVRTVRVFAPHDEVVTTNVASFVTNDVLVDGKRVAASGRFVNDVGTQYRTLAVRLTPGEHSLGFAARTPALALALRALALFALAVMCWLAVRPPRGLRREGDAPAGA